MVQLVGLNPHEEILVTGLIAQFSSDEFLMGELRRVEKHRMSSEYYANRIACRYADEADIFLAFKSDHAGFRQAIADSDWAGVLIYYALLLGIMHGMGQLDCDPLRLIAAPQDLPRAVLDGIEAFRHQSVGFFDGYGTDTDLAEAA